MGNGMATLARATAIADLYGAGAYGTIASVAGGMTTAARAAGPFAAARLRRRRRLHRAALDARRARARRRGARLPRRTRTRMTTQNRRSSAAASPGLAAAYAARRAGLAPSCSRPATEPAGSWPHYYDSLTLFSPARYSELPGRPFGGDRDRYPTRDEVVDYLRAYAAELDADIRCGQRVAVRGRTTAASRRTEPGSS